MRMEECQTHCRYSSNIQIKIITNKKTIFFDKWIQNFQPKEIFLESENKNEA